jgi:hypothetical protein
MTKKYPILLCLVSVLSAAPLLAQSLRIDTTRTILRDRDGNIIGSHFRIHVDGTFEERMETLRSEKVAFFTSNIQLTSKEAERFWPLYNEYFRQKEKFAARRNLLLQQISSEQTMIISEDKEMKTLLDAYLACTKQEADLHMDYYKKFSAFLPAKKIARYYLCEEQFKQILLRSLYRKPPY